MRWLNWVFLGPLAAAVAVAAKLCGPMSAGMDHLLNILHVPRIQDGGGGGEEGREFGCVAVFLSCVLRVYLPCATAACLSCAPVRSYAPPPHQRCSGNRVAHQLHI